MAKCAIITITFNEPDMLRMWYDYYSGHFADDDIYILDDSSDGGISGPYFDGIGGHIERTGIDREDGQPKDVNDGIMHQAYCDKFKELIKSYQYVMKVDTDEFVVPDPEKWPGGLAEWIELFKGQFAQCSGYNVLDTTGKSLDISSRPWLAQRKHWHRDWHHYCKVVIANEFPHWGGGSHHSVWQQQWVEEIGEFERVDFRLIHMHYACRELLRRRWVARKSADGRFNPNEVDGTIRSYIEAEDMPLEEIPDKWRQAI